jgi:hypothetical protein
MKKWLFAGLTVLCVSAIATRVTLAHDHGRHNKASLKRHDARPSRSAADQLRGVGSFYRNR